jgi:pseudaminic acid cytidylyltransferase
MKLAVIVARKNSERIKNKNIKIFYGKPILSYSIKTAQKSKLFDKIIVSTNCKIIKKVAQKHGAEVPFIRPENISDDNTKTITVVQHSIKWLKNNNFKPEYVCCIYPVAPLIHPIDLKKSFNILKKNNYDFIISSGKYCYPINKSFTIRNKRINLYKASTSSLSTKFFTPSYHDAGQFYWGKRDTWEKKRNLLNNNSFPYILPYLRFWDVDYPEDWVVLEKLFKLQKILKI